MSLVLGVDVGGTFTDLFLFDDATGAARVAKVPSTRGREADGFLAGIARLAEPAALSAIVHGTTVGTNALLERAGAKAGLITTQGFRDVLAMRRRDRRQTWGLTGNFIPVIPRDRRIEVAERILADGSVLTPVDPAEITAAAQTLLEAGCQSVCIVFLHSYANPANEQSALAAVRAIWPTDHVATSPDILPEIRESARTSTAALNPVLRPVVGSYLSTLNTRLREADFTGPLSIVQSNGGVMSLETATRFPVRTALSGPAAGVIAAARIAVAAGYPNVITGDVGGTSFDVSLIEAGRPSLAAQTTLEFGQVVRAPMIEITSIGAGGGSIARIDTAGLLQVGPSSAGSIPGPACYGAGGTLSTVTDANLLLGRIDGQRPIGNRPALDVDAAARAIELHVASRLGMDVMSAAEAILEVANARMAGALRLVSIERGHDPKDFAYMPFGGGGGLHAGAMVRELGLACALVPRYPGVTSALGCVIADMRHDRVRTLARPLAALDPDFLAAEMANSEAILAPLLDGAGMRFAARHVEHALDMHYQGQTHTVSVKMPAALDHASLADAFAATYAGSYGGLLPHVPIRVMNLRTTLIGTRPPIDLASLAPGPEASLDASLRPARRVWFGGWTEAAIHDRLLLPVGAEIAGPAVLQQPDATILVEPGQVARVDRLGNLIVEMAR